MTSVLATSRILKSGDALPERGKTTAWFRPDRVVITRSFARIAETNLKKLGILSLMFADLKDYDRIQK